MLQKFTTCAGNGQDLRVDPQGLLQGKKENLQENSYYDSKVAESAYGAGEAPPRLLVAIKCVPFLLFSSRIQVQLGKHNLALTESTQQLISSAKVIRHSGYSAATLDNDIMLIKLAQPAQLSRAVQTIPLPTSCVATGTTCLISGWGNTLSNASEYSVGTDSITRARERL